MAFCLARRFGPSLGLALLVIVWGWLVLEVFPGSPSAARPALGAAQPTTARTPVPATVAGKNDATVRFAVVGDFGNAGQPEADVANLVKGWKPDFVITVGDNNYDRGGADTIDANIGQYYHDFIAPYKGIYGPGASTNRFWPALGNHDWNSIYCSGSSCAGPYRDYFTLPGNERYYDFVQGNVHFFVVDSDESEPDGVKSTSKQARWLRSALSAATESWKVVYLHHAPYSSGAHGSTEALRWPYQAWGAHIVLAGHDHIYERLVVDGFPYIVNGLGGKDIYDFATPLPYSQVRYNGDYGALLVEADNCTLAFRFFSRANQLVDTYNIAKKCPNATPTSTPTAVVTPTPFATVAALYFPLVAR